MKHLLIVYHSQSGNTRQLAEAALAGARQEADTESRLIHATTAALEDLLWCDALIVATPENFGYMSGLIKDFFDRTFYPAEPYALNRGYALLVSAGNDGSGAVRECDRILSGYPMRKVLDPVIARNGIHPADREAASELGLTLATGLTLGIF